jgi:hypothetical protein
VAAVYEAQPLNSLYISVVSIAEIRFGIELQEDVTRRAELTDWLTLTLRPAFAGRILGKFGIIAARPVNKGRGMCQMWGSKGDQASGGGLKRRQTSYEDERWREVERWCGVERRLGG